MKLFTHNLLCCTKCASYPLEIKNIEKKELSSNPMPPNYILLRNLYDRLNFETLKNVAKAIGIEGLPDEFPEEFPISLSGGSNQESSENFVKALSTLLFDVELVDCDLYCDHCKRVYPVADKIPNLVLNEVEIEEKGKYLKERGTKQFIVHEASSQYTQGKDSENQESDSNNEPDEESTNLGDYMEG